MSLPGMFTTDEHTDTYSDIRTNARANIHEYYGNHVIGTVVDDNTSNASNDINSNDINNALAEITAEINNLLGNISNHVVGVVIDNISSNTLTNINGNISNGTTNYVIGHAVHDVSDNVHNDVLNNYEDIYDNNNYTILDIFFYSIRCICLCHCSRQWRSFN